MIRHAWTVLADKVIIDRDTNNLSLDVLEQVSVELPPLPAGKKAHQVPLRLEVVSLWYRENPSEPEHGKARIRVVDPSGTVFQSSEMDVDLSGHSRLRTRGVFGSILLTSAGLYFAITEQANGDEWSEVARIPIQVEMTIKPA